MIQAKNLHGSALILARILTAAAWLLGLAACTPSATAPTPTAVLPLAQGQPTFLFFFTDN